MVKRVVLLLAILMASLNGDASSAFAQKVEHGLLLGGGLGIPMQDGAVFTLEEHYGYNNKVKASGTVAYRFRFNLDKRNFIDLDPSISFQSMQVYKYKALSLGDIDKIPEDEYLIPPGESFTDFIMPISLSATYNYRFSDKFYAGLGLAPIFYMKPQPVFDLGILAKVGYRVCKRCEVAFSYQYGCLDVLKHFNAGEPMGRRGHYSDLMLSVYIPFSVK